LRAGRGLRRLLAVHSGLVYVFLYAPIVILVVFSFNAARQTAFWQGFTLDWYRRLLDNDPLLRAVRNSLVVAGATTAAAVALGTPAALALARLGFRGKRATRTLLYLPVIIPEVVLGAALLTFFGAVEMRLSLWTVVIAHVVFSVSYVARWCGRGSRGSTQPWKRRRATWGPAPSRPSGGSPCRSPCRGSWPAPCSSSPSRSTTT
jgi:spermidine/putrescine transport system permease protein